ncbi:MAG TPA: response regulator [Stellaceae bacterium]|nr:response regulator [Stellaceae bacterium]
MPVYTILVVDDDRDLLDLAPQVLANPGYMVATAESGYEAIRILADRHVDLMVIDVRMPGLNGFELARQARLMRPRIRVLFMSGYAGEFSRGEVPPYAVLLEKPVRPSELLAAIRREFDA